MDPPPASKKSFPPSKSASVDVNRLDKVNTYLNKSSRNVLMEELCLHDRQFIRAIMEDDSSESDENREVPCGSSTWSPMVQSPLMMNKHMRKSKPPSSVALSLEDISYIRPSWGLSKGIKTIKVNKRKKRKRILESERRSKETDEKPSQSDMLYRYLFVALAFFIMLLTIPTYVKHAMREEVLVNINRIRIDARSRFVEIFRDENDQLQSILKLNIAQGIPSNLKPDRCTCEGYTKHLRTMNRSFVDSEGECLGCFDWAVRANLRVYLTKNRDDNTYCYNFKWQSYDSLGTPLIDCFQLEDNQWFGIGDLHAPVWPLEKLQFDWTTIRTNLTYETKTRRPEAPLSLSLGAYVNFSLMSTKGITIGEVKTDFEVAIKMQRDPAANVKSLCIGATCTDKCTQNWLRKDQVNLLRYSNNILEYNICSAPNLKTLIVRQYKRRPYSTNSAGVEGQFNNTSDSNGATLNGSNANYSHSMGANTNLLERETLTISYPNEAGSREGGPEPMRMEQMQLEPPEGIGLMERNVFSTEFMPVLDGQTLRQFVDNIVKLGLKSSPILLIDSRWETYAGSLKLNTALFPKAKLLFEILHNKGFKIVFTVKPYIDAGVGVMSLNQLLDAGRLYSVEYRNDNYMKWRTDDQNKGSKKMALKEYVLRRKSLFLYENQSITIGLDEGQTLPYIFKCKESKEGYCALTDLTQVSNRAWMINGIMRSSFTTLGADGIQIGGPHPDNLYWDDHYRAGMSELVKSLMFKEKFYTIPQWTGDYGYIQLAPRTCDWDSLRSVISSVQNLGMMGFSLVHPGSVWGDLNSTRLMISRGAQQEPAPKSLVRIESIYGDVNHSERADEELVIRWLQVAMFLPILQFNSIAPIEKHGLQELVQNLTRIRKNFVVPELKLNLPYTPLISQSRANMYSFAPALIRPVWHNNNESEEVVVPDQFMIGPNILVAPILVEGQRQRDIYLPNGFWRDELKQENIRGGKWLRNYPIELNEIAWFTRLKR